MLDDWIARYTTLPLPWGNPGDSASLKPRDWDSWVFWQFSADGNGRGPEFGAQSASIDLNYFNGDETDFRVYCGYAEPTLEERIERLEIEARAHGWNIP